MYCLSPRTLVPKDCVICRISAYMERNDRRMKTDQSYSLRTWLRFVLFSAFGVFAFFINFRLPEYQFVIGPWQWGKVAAQSNVLVSHFTNFLKAALYTGNFKAMPFVVWGFGVFSIIDLFLLRPDRFWKTTKVAAAFAVFKIIGFGLLTVSVLNIYFGFNPSWMGWYLGPVASLGGKSIASFIMDSILVTICISIPAAALFLPLLVDYGLVDFVGVFVRPIMRPVFKLPGRAAIIMVSAFLGSFSVGHIAVNDQYKSGRMTRRESVVICTSMSTASVGFLLALANSSGLTNSTLWGGTNYWNLYFWMAFLVTMLVTLIGVRIPPLSRTADDFFPGVTPNPEQVVRTNIARTALKEGLDMAAQQQSLTVRVSAIMKDTFLMMGTVASGTAFFGALGVVLYTFTPIIDWIGYLFRPLFMLFGFRGQELATAATGAVISFVEITVPALLVSVGTWSLRLRFMMAVLPVTSIIFLASFVPCLMATDVPVSFGEMVVIWLERMVLSILICGIIAVLLFPATVVA